MKRKATFAFLLALVFLLSSCVNIPSSSLILEIIEVQPKEGESFSATLSELPLWASARLTAYYASSSSVLSEGEEEFARIFLKRIVIEFNDPNLPTVTIPLRATLNPGDEVVVDFTLVPSSFSTLPYLLKSSSQRTFVAHAIFYAEDINGRVASDQAEIAFQLQNK